MFASHWVRELQIAAASQCSSHDRSLDRDQSIGRTEALTLIHSFGKTALMKYWLLLVPLFLMGTTVEKTHVGKTLYLQHCVSCHGVDGKGDGPVAARLSTPPADLTRIAARRDGVWPAFEVMTILSGYSRNILPREDMPIIVDLLDNEMSEFDRGNGETILMPTKLIAIASYLETLQDPAPKSNLP